jgi:hypothetical protein
LEHLEILDEFLKCRNDDDINRRKARFQDVLNRETIRATKRVMFIERYVSGESSLNIHGRVRMVQGEGTLNFCAVIESPKERGIFSNFRVTYTGAEKIQASMFIDVRELGQEPEPRIGFSKGIVRLQTLDECKGAYGNPGQELRKGFMAERYRGRPNIFRELQLQREGDFIPIDRCGHEVAHFDETERQVVECRPHLIQSFSNGDSNVMRGESNLHCCFTIRLHDDFVRLAGGISRNAVFDFLDVFRCPEEFEIGGIDVINHENASINP